MDERAISFATEENLRQLGLVAQGDIFALKAFVADELSKRPSPTQEDSREEGKKMLIEKLVLGTKKVGGTNVTTTVKEKKAKVLQVLLIYLKQSIVVMSIMRVYQPLVIVSIFIKCTVHVLHISSCHGLTLSEKLYNSKELEC